MSQNYLILFSSFLGLYPRSIKQCLMTAHLPRLLNCLMMRRIWLASLSKALRAKVVNQEDTSRSPKTIPLHTPTLTSTVHSHSSALLQSQIPAPTQLDLGSLADEAEAGFFIFQATRSHLFSVSLKQTGLSDLPPEWSGSPASWLSCSSVSPSSTGHWKLTEKVPATGAPGQRWR